MVKLNYVNSSFSVWIACLEQHLPADFRRLDLKWNRVQIQYW